MKPEGTIPCPHERATWSQPEPGKSISHHYIHNIILPLCLDLSIGLSPSRFPTTILYAFRMCATCSVHLILFNLITLIIFGKDYKLWSPPSCSFLQLLVTSSPFGPNILLSALFSNLTLFSLTRFELLWRIHVTKHSLAISLC